MLLIHHRSCRPPAQPRALGQLVRHPPSEADEILLGCFGVDLAGTPGEPTPAACQRTVLPPTAVKRVGGPCLRCADRGERLTPSLRQGGLSQLSD
jgi:hypothetical protein